MNSFRNLAVSAAALAFLATPAIAADTTLRISLQLPLKSHLGQNLLVLEQEV